MEKITNSFHIFIEDPDMKYKVKKVGMYILLCSIYQVDDGRFIVSSVHRVLILNYLFWKKIGAFFQKDLLDVVECLFFWTNNGYFSGVNDSTKNIQVEDFDIQITDGYILIYSNNVESLLNWRQLFVLMTNKKSVIRISKSLTWMFLLKHSNQESIYCRFRKEKFNHIHKIL